MSTGSYQRPGEMSLVEKLWQINWGLVLIVCLVASLGFALLYNVIAIPLAVVGVLQPLHAAAAMSLSSLVVTGNAVRLLRWRPRR